MKKEEMKKREKVIFNSNRNSLLKVFVVFSLLTILIIISNLQFISATNYCAEKTKSGAWCQNVPLDQVDENYRKAPTSCDATSFCRLGTCVDNKEGVCSPNVPQRVCQQNEGSWEEGEPEEIPQCQLGCCLLGDQAAFVTQTRCKALSSDYGVETNYRTDIGTELECLVSANPDVKGACVFDDSATRNCEMLTRGECLAREEQTGANTTIEFHQGLLCSAESLNTRCGRSQKTACVPDKDEVYFVDTCGNIANIYDAGKVNNAEYWTSIKERDESCGLNSTNGNAGSRTCGSCDYLAGSLCRQVERGNSATPQPQHGDFVCADLSCRYDGKTYKHGETWCSSLDSRGTVINVGSNASVPSEPGLEHRRLVCYSGEVTVEQCSPMRSEVCVQDAIPIAGGEFKTGECRMNLWQDCIFQNNKDECEDIDQRDCRWLEGQSLARDEEGRFLLVNSEGELVQQNQDNTGKGAACLPKYPPGFDFWNEESEAEELCAVANDNCLVKFTKGVGDIITGGDYECKENCHCLGLKKGDSINRGTKNSEWASDRNNMCIALGDCGIKKNYLGVQGYHNTSVVEITAV